MRLVQRLALFACLTPSLLLADTKPSQRHYYNHPTGQRHTSSQSYSQQQEALEPDDQYFYVLELFGDYTYWNIRQEGLDFAMSGITDNPLLTQTAPTKGKVFTLPFKYQSGFKGGIALRFHDGAVDTKARYTWSSVKNHKRVEDESGQTLTPLWQIGTNYTNPSQNVLYAPISAEIDSANAAWDLAFNAADLEFGINLEYEKIVRIRPHVGLKAYWGKEHFYINYSDSTASTGGFGGSNNYQHDASIGIRGGTGVEWQVFGPLYVVGDVTAATMWRAVRNTRLDDSNYDGASSRGTQTILDIRDSNKYLTPVFEGRVGLSLSTPIMDEKFHVSVNALWEHQVWVSHLQMLRITTAYGNSRDTNLTIQGLTAGLSLGF